MPETWMALYGNRSGRWLLLRGPVGRPGPPSVDHLTRLGSPSDLVTALNTAGVLQRELADALGISQQHVSRVIAGTSGLDDDAQWSALVRLAHGRLRSA